MVDTNAMRKTFVVPDVKPWDQYDINRAKICASVGWVLAKSYGNAGTDPFTHNTYRTLNSKITPCFIPSLCAFMRGGENSAPPRHTKTHIKAGTIHKDAFIFCPFLFAYKHLPSIACKRHCLISNCF